MPVLCQARSVLELTRTNPERQLAAGDGCWYEEQMCSRESCDGVDLRNGLICIGGHWQGELFTCPQPRDAG